MCRTFDLRREKSVVVVTAAAIVVVVVLVVRAVRSGAARRGAGFMNERRYLPGRTDRGKRGERSPSHYANLVRALMT